MLGGASKRDWLGWLVHPKKYDPYLRILKAEVEILQLFKPLRRILNKA
jgi:hypothetical protein